MTFLLPALVVIQAALLFWAAIHLSQALLPGPKLRHAVRAVLISAVPLAIAWHGGARDPQRVLAGAADCVTLVGLVGFVRFWVATKQEQRASDAQAHAAQLAAERTEAAQKAHAAQKIAAANATLAASPSAAASPSPARGKPPA